MSGSRTIADYRAKLGGAIDGQKDPVESAAENPIQGDPLGRERRARVAK